MKNSILKIIFFTFIAMSNGCSSYAGNFGDWTGRSQIENDIKQQKDNNEQLQKYLGMTKDQIKAEFGKPARIQRDIEYIINPGCPSGNCERQVAEEVWTYGFEKGVPFFAPNYSTIQFYFINDKVVHFEA